MEIMELVCKTCGRVFEVDDIPRRGSVCFGCHCKGIRLGFRHGKEDFHGPTIKERQEKTLADARQAGINAVPASEYGF